MMMRRRLATAYCHLDTFFSRRCFYLYQVRKSFYTGTGTKGVERNQISLRLELLIGTAQWSSMNLQLVQNESGEAVF